jgi:hypothetical protein
MYEIRTVSVALIDPNPHRDLGNYPWMPRKIAQLQRSINDVGFWAGVIARPKGKRYELAFGHHRIEAARRNKLTEVPLILDDITDRQMLQYMGRENGEDYSADMIVMLNTWEGALRFLSNSKDYRKSESIHSRPQPIEIAGLLGWVIVDKNDQRHMNHVAAACAAGHALIAGGYVARADLNGLSVSDARELLTRTQQRIEQLERIGRREGHKRADTQHAQSVIGKAARITAREVSKGEVATKDIRTRVDINTMRATGKAAVKAQAPLFAAFGEALCRQISHMLATDSAAERINEIAKAMEAIELDDDRAVIRKLHHELDELTIRARRAKTRTIPDKVVRLKAIQQEGA